MTIASETDVADAVRGGTAFHVQGGGTRGVGLAQGEVLDTSGLSGISLYEPEALTIVAGAGTRVSEINAALAAERQRLAFEPPMPGRLLGRSGDSTIGGVVSANASGPRRVVAGACRDFCLGVRFVDGRGTVVKNGGRVMKNVTGYDLVKLMAGSHGTLGVLTEISLKTQPLPECAATLRFEGLSDATAIEALSHALGTPFDVSGAAHLPANDLGAAQTLLRIEGFETSVKYRVQSLQSALSGFGEGAVDWTPEIVDNTWGHLRDVTRFVEAGGDVWRVSVRPSEAAGFVARVAPRDVFYDWGGGLVWLLTEAGTDVRAHLENGHATLVRASEQTKRDLGVFQPETGAVARLTAGLRAQFDPEQKFNRGMMA